MAVLSSERFNMVEWSKKLHRGTVLPEVELLAQNNPCAEDVPWQQANQGFSHLYSLVTSHPTVSKAAFGEGSNSSKSTSAQETETTTMLLGLSEVEDDLAQVGGAAGIVRAREDGRFAEQMKQEMAKLLFYGNRATNTRDIDGFATRYPALTGTKSKNVFSCAESSPTANQQTSIYGAVWGDGLYGIVPEGTTAGYAKENLGKYPKVLASGKTMVMLGTKHRWHIGIVQEDWRAGGRICNIDVPAAKALSGKQATTSVDNVLHKMLLLKQRLDRVAGKRVMYCNETVGGLLMRLCLEKSTAALSLREAATQLGPTTQQLHFFEYPIRVCDQILDTEAVVS